MSAPNRLEQAMAQAVFDESRRPEFVRALLEAELWFPMDYHPELDNPARPDAHAHVTFWIAGDDTGRFVPLFTGSKVLRKAMEQFRRPYTRAVLPGREVLAALLRQGHTVRINPGNKFTAGLDLRGLADILSGELLARAGRPPERGTANLKFPPVTAWPAELLTNLAEECEEQPGVLAVWLGLAGEESPELGALHVVVWVREQQRTTIDNIQRAVRRQWPERAVEYVRLDEAGEADSLTAVRVFAPVFPRVST